MNKIITTFLLACLLTTGASAQARGNITIGIRAHNGEEIALAKWTATADYLSEKIDGYRFTVVPIVEFDDMKKAVDANKVDFVLTNPAAYIDLELNHGVVSIATLVNHQGKAATNRFAGVIITRAERNDINRLEDIKDKTLIAVHPEAFGGWWMTLGEFRKNNIDPYKLAKKVIYSGTQMGVVFSVLNGEVDMGTMRTGILEKLVNDGHLAMADIKIVNRKNNDFPLPHSTSLYPEWALAKTKQAPPKLAEQVAKALFEMPADDRGAITGGYTGWTVPLSYQSVHELLKTLKVGAYKEYGSFTFNQVLSKYRIEITIALLMLLIAIIATVYIIRVNRLLCIAKKKLEDEIIERKKTEQDLKRSLNEVKTLQEILPICSFCKKIRDDDGYWEQVDVYIREHSNTDFSHSICPGCMKEHYPEIELKTELE